MKVEIELSKFQSLINRAKNIINEKSAITILHNFLIRAEDNVVTLIATDLDTTTIVVKEEANVIEQGATVINARKLSDLVKSMKSPVVTFESDENEKVLVTLPGSKFKMSGISAEEFPNISYSTEDNYILKMEGVFFKYLLDYTSFAVSKDVGILSGLNFEIREEFVRIVATDSHKLGLCDNKRQVEISENSTVTLPFDFVIPTKTAKNLSDSISDDTVVTIDYKDNSVIFKYENSIIISKLLDGKYPNYEAVIPKNNENIAVLDRKTLIDAINTANVLSEVNQHKINFKFHEDLTISSSNTEIGGETEQHIDIDYNGEEIQIAFNANYILEMLRVIKTDKIEIYMNNSKLPVVIKPMPLGEDQEVILLLMPLRV